MLKKITAYISTALLITLFSVVPVFATSAADRLSGVGPNAGYAETNETSIATGVGGVINTILSVAGIIFMSYIVWAGWIWMTAKGDEEKVKRAKDMTRTAIIGIIIALSAYSITATIIDRFSSAGGFIG